MRSRGRRGRWRRASRGRRRACRTGCGRCRGSRSWALGQSTPGGSKVGGNCSGGSARGLLGAVHDSEVLILILLIALPGLSVISRQIDVPYPILLVLGGLALGLMPGLPSPELEPDLVLVIFLPPLLYVAAFFADLRDLRANARPISLLSIGLVLVTAITVAIAAHHA